jgi:poly(3-hydroxyalkanoate) synthetase
VSAAGPSAAPAAASHGAAGYSQKELVWQSGKLRLYRYRPIARDAAGHAPLLIVYALVNRPYMMDLQEDRSLIRGLLAAGLDVYLIDWGYPDGADRFTTLADYIEDYLAGCVQRILQTHRLDALNLLGVCQGGRFQPVLCGAASAAGAQPDHHGHAGGFSNPGGPAVEVGRQDRRCGLGGRRQRLG